jgi:hypothetical protein
VCRGWEGELIGQGHDHDGGHDDGEE